MRLVTSAWLSRKLSDKTYRADYNFKARIKKRNRDAVKDKAPFGCKKAMLRWEKSWRDKPKVKCFWCLGLFRGSDCHVDHITPLSTGGRHSVENLCVSCADCNLKKSNTKLSEWNQKIAQPVLL